MKQRRDKASIAERVLIVEDDESLAELLSQEISDMGLEVRTAPHAEAAVSSTGRWTPDLIISDLRLPGPDGMALLGHSRSITPVPAFIVITAFGTVAQAVKALQQGADDFLTKPLDFEHLRLSVSRALETRRLRNQLVFYRELLGEDGFHGLIGTSRPMQELFGQIRMVARGNGPVLISGESGVGKELVARAVHEESERSEGPFVAVNCAGIPEQLLESEFFGHAAGAFTGAVRARNGLFTEADKGTLLLDELTEMPPSLQAKLLRVLQEGKIRPVGSDTEHAIDVRIVAATNRNLESEVEAGRLREDLFYRLETFTLTVPRLREREDDWELLAAHFLRRFCLRLDKEVRGFSPEALQHLRGYSFPGNVRELRNAVERAATFCEGPFIKPEHLPPRILRAAPEAIRRAETDPEVIQRMIGNGTLPSLSELEARYIRYVVDHFGGNKRRAASLLGVGRGTLYRRLEEES